MREGGKEGPGSSTAALLVVLTLTRTLVLLAICMPELPLKHMLNMKQSVEEKPFQTFHCAVTTLCQNIMILLKSNKIKHSFLRFHANENIESQTQMG